MSRRGNFATILSIATVAVALSVSARTAVAGDNNPTADQILKALAPKPLTRGLSAGPQVDPAKVAAESAFVKKIRNRATRSLSSDEREEIATMAQDKPNIDLEINFDYDSADINARSMPSVQALGKALTNPDLKGSTFVVAGYTDAAGSEAYNQELSERRADSIKHYLVDKFGIASGDLVTVGYGKTRLKDPDRPMAEANRRVKVVNMETKQTAPQ
ncbi:MAG: OmpA family protein [Bradyrhizobium sp.]|uniref:OmpA family protein n=1 Tax=Bradyrhizobium sp. TaxID=376 RepID=UPI0023A56E99|nr:OmpA family protein [Bradyrhizobium sp.]MDE2602680.1 OmpA family protein [Bradyrhizobium sp.]